MAEWTEAELDRVRRIPLFGALPAAALAELAAQEDCHLAQTEKGESIYTPHDYDRALGVLLTGRVQVSKEGFVVNVLEEGDLFGAAALFNDRENYATTLTALTPCRMAFFPQQLMSRAMAAHPPLAEAYVRYLSDRIRFLEGKLDALLAPGAQRRLGQYLLERQAGGRVTLDCPVSGLAGRLDVSRASLYRAFDALTQAGAIVKQGRTILICKEELLS